MSEFSFVHTGFIRLQQQCHMPGGSLCIMDSVVSRVAARPGHASWCVPEFDFVHILVSLGDPSHLGRVAAVPSG